MAALVGIISGCQDILRRRTDQCSFVSLRDVNRFIEVRGSIEDCVCFKDTVFWRYL